MVGVAGIGRRIGWCNMIRPPCSSESILANHRPAWHGVRIIVVTQTDIYTVWVFNLIFGSLLLASALLVSHPQTQRCMMLTGEQ